MKRTMDATFLNSVANHSEVRPWLGGEGPLDMGPVLQNAANIALEFPGGGFVLMQHEPGVYEAHTMFLPGQRSGALASAREGFRYLFAATDCVKVLTKVPDGNAAAARFAMANGFREVFRSQGTTHYELTLDSWRATDSECLKAGEWFHSRLEVAKAESGSGIASHDDDEAHDRAAGSAVLMFRAGNPVKAVATYNAWAKFAGYAQLGLLNLNPPIVDLIDAVVEVRGEDMEILLCR